MKYTFILALVISVLSSCSMFPNQEVKMLSAKVDSLARIIDTLTQLNKTLDEEFTWIENELVNLHTAQPQKSKTASAIAAPATQTETVVAKPANDWQCQALTSSGKRCSRPAIEGSKYCWQHKKTYEPNSPSPESKPKPAESSNADKK
jgi:hypothetical protein